MAKKRIINGVHKGKDRESPHPFWTLCANELVKVFSEIVNDTELLSKCYCPVRSRDFDEELLYEITTGIPSVLICTKDILPDVFLEQNLLKSKHSQPFLIVNDVGSGKTTYLYHYFLINIKQSKLDDKIDGVIINIKEFGEGEDIRYEKIEDFFNKKIHDYLTAKYPNISSPDIESGSKIFEQELIPYAGILKDRKKINEDDYKNSLLTKIDQFVSNLKLFNRARIRYLNKIGKKIFLVIDNVDHFGRKTQEKIFGLSTALMADFQCGIIMSARDYTVPFAFRHMPLSAYEPRFLHLALPDPKKVIQKRVEYLLETDYVEKIFNILGKDRIEVIAPSGSRLVFEKPQLKREFNIILNALLNIERIVDLLQNLSDYDMRALLKMVRVVLSSGYLFPEERERRDEVREGDFLRAMMCGNNPYYFPDDESAMVLNLFDDNNPIFEGNNLIRLRAIQAISTFGKKALVSDVLKFMVSLGYPEDRVNDVLQLLIDFDLIESPYHEGSNIKKDNIEVLKLTFAGYYYLNDLIFNPVYLQEVKNACYLGDTYTDVMANYIEQGKKAGTKKERISSRLEATKIFLEAIEQEENSEGQRIKNIGMPECLINYGKIEKVANKIQSRFDEISNKIISSVVD